MMDDVTTNIEPSPEIAIETQDLTKQFDGVTAVNKLTLDVPRGTILGFIGPSGCGKTTTVRLMMGNYRPTDGMVKVFGRPPGSFTRAEQKRIGYMPQLFILYPELTVWENMNFAASLYGYPMKRKERFRELLDLVELTGHEKKRVRDISGGMQRRLSLATTLIHKPELIFLDEPTAGIDPVLRQKFWEHFRRLRDEGYTLFITTQYVGEAAYCDNVGVMASGNLLMVEPPDKLRYRAMGGEIVELSVESPLSKALIAALGDLPFVTGDVTFLDPVSLQLTVEDASTAIPQLLHWCEERDIAVESIGESVPPFDDVFVRIMQEQATDGKQEE